VHAKADLIEGIHPSLQPRYSDISKSSKIRRGESELLDKQETVQSTAAAEEPLDESDGEEQPFEPYNN
jgi:hypothetical protein